LVQRGKRGEVEGQSFARQVLCLIQLRTEERVLREGAPLVENLTGRRQQLLLTRAERRGNRIFVVAVCADNAVQHLGGGVVVAFALVRLAKRKERFNFIFQ